MAKQKEPKTAREKAVARNKARQRAYVELAGKHEDEFEEILAKKAKELGLKPRTVWS